ncbi:metallophosphoesterase family protein [Spirochaeta dissipatitropha]
MNSFSLQNLDDLYKRTESEELPGNPIVIFSDFHLGDGSIKDDFAHNSELTMAVLEEYFRLDYILILNGDVEELQKFELGKIMKRWKSLYSIFDRFERAGRLIRLVGNHDLALLLGEGFGIPVRESLLYKRGKDEIFIFHGHQASRRYAVYNEYVGLLLKYLVSPLPVRNISVSHDNRKRKKLEERVYRYSSNKGLLSIIGHTHRPLFESLSKTDYVKYNIERLCRQYALSDDRERSSIESEIHDLKKHLVRTLPDKKKDFGSIYHEDFVVPCMFNSGCVLGKRGISCIELNQENISLQYWFDKDRSKRYLRYDGYDTSQLSGTTFFNTLIKDESLDYVFSRIRLLT